MDRLMAEEQRANIRKGPQAAGKYKAGDKRVIDGKTCVRDDKSTWNSQ
jgi:hypothetical protein